MVFNVLGKFKDDVNAYKVDVYEKALKEIANGEGIYGMQAKEYKDIAKAAIQKCKFIKEQP